MCNRQNSSHTVCSAPRSFLDDFDGVDEAIAMMADDGYYKMDSPPPAATALGEAEEEHLSADDVERYAAVLMTIDDELSGMMSFCLDLDVTHRTHGGPLLCGMERSSFVEMVAFSRGWFAERAIWKRRDVLRFLRTCCGDGKIDKAARSLFAYSTQALCQSFVATHARLFPDSGEQITAFEMTLVVLFWERDVLDDGDEGRCDVIDPVDYMLPCRSLTLKQYDRPNSDIESFSRRVDAMRAKFDKIHKETQ